MGMDKFKAGDVIQYPDGRQDYLIEIPGEDGLWVNACNTSWIDRGLRGYGCGLQARPTTEGGGRIGEETFQVSIRQV